MKKPIYLFIIILFPLVLACNMTNILLPSKNAEPGQFNMAVPNYGHGQLHFLVEDAKASQEGARPVHGCWPADYYDDGSGYLYTEKNEIHGHCEWTSPSEKNPAVTWNNNGKLDGSYDPETAVVSFHLITTQETSNTTITVIFDGAGYFTSKDHAEGQATWTSTCESWMIDEFGRGFCGTDYDTTWNITGTVPWTIDFSDPEEED